MTNAARSAYEKPQFLMNRLSCRSSGNGTVRLIMRLSVPSNVIDPPAVTVTLPPLPAPTVEEVMRAHESVAGPDLEAILAADSWARRRAAEHFS